MRQKSKWDREKAKDYYKEYRTKNRVKLRELHRAWKRKRPERNNLLNQNERDRLKVKVLSHYSPGGIPNCTLCGFNKIEALCLDHITDNGAAERIEKLGNRLAAGTTFYRWIKKMNFPPGYQTLCFNCNMIKEVYRRRGNTNPI